MSKYIELARSLAARQREKLETEIAKKRDLERKKQQVLQDLVKNLRRELKVWDGVVGLCYEECSGNECAVLCSDLTKVLGFSCYSEENILTIEIVYYTEKKINDSFYKYKVQTSPSVDKLLDDCMKEVARYLSKFFVNEAI